MLKRIGTHLAVFLCPAGMVSFITFGAWRLPVLLGLALLYMVFALYLTRGAAYRASIWLPFASGLLIPVMRLFYWDRFDFRSRIGLLLFFSLLLSLIGLLRVKNAWQQIASRFQRLSRKRQAIAIFVFTETLLVAAAVTLTLKGVKIAGDEPHYMAVSQSIARDGDLNVFNQYFRNLFKEFVAVENLPAHGTFGKGYKRIYSSHLPGLSLTMAPFFLTRLPHTLLYILVRSYLGLYGALLAVLIYFFSLRLLGDEGRSLLATLLFSLTAPVFFFSIHIFPEIQATLLVLGALYLLLYPGKNENRNTLLAGLLLGATLFWGLKYSLFLYLYVAGFLVYFCRKKKFKRALLLLVFPLLFQGLFFYYLHYAYGTLSPNAVYYGMQSPEQSRQLMKTLFETITLRMRLETLLDYFFDQRDGLLLYNPLYFFAFPGLILALKKGKKYLPHLLLALPAIAFIANHAFSTIRPGFCPQARYLVPTLWILLLFAIIYLRDTANAGFKKIFAVLPYYAFFVTGYQVLHPATLYQPTTHDMLWRPGLMFQQWSNLKINLSGLLPSFIKTDNSRYLANWICLGLFLLLTILSICPWRKDRKSFAPPIAAALFFFSLLALFPRPGLYNPTLITPKNGSPYFLFEKNSSPRETAAAQREVRRSGEYAFTIGIRQHEESVGLRLRSLTPEGAAQVRIFLADQQLQYARLEAGSIQSVHFLKPKAIRSGNLLLYPFHLSVAFTKKEAASGLALEFYILRKPEY